jgi:hypothetical protein
MATPVQLPDIMGLVKSSVPTGTNPADTQLATDQLAMDIVPQQQSITSTINTINQYLERDVNTQQQYGQIADQKIADVGSQLAQKLQTNVGAIGGIYDKGVQQVGAGYDEASKTLQGIGDYSVSQITGRAAGLGQQQALTRDTQFGTDPLSRLQAGLATMQGRAASSKAGATSELASLGTALKGIAQKTVGDSERDYAQKRTDVATQVLKVIGQLQLKAGEGIMDQLQRFSALASTAGPAFRTLLSQATSARTKAEREQAMDLINMQLKLEDQAMAREKHTAAMSKSYEEEDPNSLDNQLKRINIAKGERELGRGEYISESEGNQNLLNYLNSVVRVDRESPGISGTAHKGIQNFIQTYLPEAQMSGMYNTSDPARILATIAQNNIDPKTGLVNLPVTPGSQYKQQDYQVDLQTLIDALTARFGNVGTSAKIGAKI